MRSNQVVIDYEGDEYEFGRPFFLIEENKYKIGNTLSSGGLDSLGSSC